MEATAIQIMLAGRPMKALAAYLSQSCPLIGVTWKLVLDVGCLS
jgi:hypothetical protein